MPGVYKPCVCGSSEVLVMDSEHDVVVVEGGPVKESRETHTVKCARGLCKWAVAAPTARDARRAWNKVMTP